MPRRYKIFAWEGDGIAPEIVPEAVKVLKAASETHGFDLEILGPHPFGAKYWDGIGRPRDRSWPAEVTMEILKKADGIFKGPVGLPWADTIMPNAVFWMRFGLDLYANIRPARLRPGVESLLAHKKAGDVDFVILRENTEDRYVPIRGKLSRGGVDELVCDVSVITRKGSERIIRQGFEMAKSGLYKGKPGAPEDGKKRLTCVNKYAIIQGDTFFRDIFHEIGKGYPEIEQEVNWVDAWSYWAIVRPEHYDVIVTQNQYGDIISDEAGAVQGSMGLAGSLNAGDDYAYAEPTHGSAPDIAGKRIANPISVILAVGMLLEWIGAKRKDRRLSAAWKRIDKAVDAVLTEGKVRTPDLGGSSSTQQMGDAIVSKIRKKA